MGTVPTIPWCTVSLCRRSQHLCRERRDRRQQCARLDWLGEEPDAAVPLGAIAQDAAATGCDDDWRRVAPVAKLLLQLEAGHSRQLHVEDDAERRRRRRSADVRLRRIEKCWLETFGAEEPTQCAPQRRIVFDDGDDERRAPWLDHRIHDATLITSRMEPGRWCYFGVSAGLIPSSMAMRVNPAIESVSSFCRICARCSLIVPSAMLSSAAACLFSRPLIRCTSTSRSRRVSRA